MWTRSIYVEIDPIVLSLVATIHTCLSLSITGIKHHKIEPTTEHLLPLQDKYIKLAKQNPNIGEQIRGYKRSCIKEIKET